MSAIPAHLQAILRGAVRPVAVAPVAPIANRAPVFTPAQSGAPHAVRSLSRTIEECEPLECHDVDTIGCDPESLAILPDSLT